MSGERLDRIAGMLPLCSVAADIGCDHGKLAALLIYRGVCKRVIAVDVSPFSVEKTRRFATDSGIAERVDVRLGDGFLALEKGEAQAAVLAGLGGELIARLMDAGRETARGMSLLLQPMQQAEILRAYLKENGWRVADEAMVEDNGRIHEMMLVVEGEYAVPDVPAGLEYEIGPLLWQRADALLLRRLKIRAEAIKQRLMAAKNAPTADRQRLATQVASLEYAAILLEKRQRGD